MDAALSKRIEKTDDGVAAKAKYCFYPQFFEVFSQEIRRDPLPCPGRAAVGGHFACSALRQYKVTQVLDLNL